MKIVKRLGIIAIVLIVLVNLLIGLMAGYPWEKIFTAHAVKEYVIETYGFTPTKVRVWFLFDTQGSAEVTTKELPFTFDVSVRRKGYVGSDNYLNSLVEYHAGKIIQEKIKALLGEPRRVCAYTVGNLTRKNNKGFTAEAVNENPDIVFAENKLRYEFRIYFEKGDGRDKIDMVCEAILKTYSPDRILITYYDENGDEGEMEYE